MFLKRLERRKNGKGHPCWALVESVRTAGSSRHRVVAHLGELKKSKRHGWATLWRRLNRAERPLPSLFDPPPFDEPADDDDPARVKLKDIRLERLRDFGDVWLALGLWRRLKLDVLLSARRETGAEGVPWSVAAAILTIARFCEPSSELHIAMEPRPSSWPAAPIDARRSEGDQGGSLNRCTSGSWSASRRG